MRTRLRPTLPVFAAFALAALLALGDSAQAAFEKEEAEIKALVEDGAISLPHSSSTDFRSCGCNPAWQ